MSKKDALNIAIESLQWRIEYLEEAINSGMDDDPNSEDELKDCKEALEVFETKSFQ